MCVRREFSNSPGTTAQVPEDYFLKWRAGFAPKHVAVERRRQVKFDWRTGYIYKPGHQALKLAARVCDAEKKGWNPPTICIVWWYQCCGINVCGYKCE